MCTMTPVSVTISSIAGCTLAAPRRKSAAVELAHIETPAVLNVNA